MADKIQWKYKYSSKLSRYNQEAEALVFNKIQIKTHLIKYTLYNSKFHKAIVLLFNIYKPITREQTIIFLQWHESNSLMKNPMSVPNTDYNISLTGALWFPNINDKFLNI